MASTCSECPKFEIEEDSKTGDCKKHKWEIDSALSKQQAVCDDTATGEIENVQILTPLGQKALISKEAYEKEKNGENYWKRV